MDIEKVLIKTECPDADYCNIVEEELDIKSEEDVQSKNDKPYKCGICGHRTTTDTLLKVHMRMHLVKRFHQCTICKKTFNFVTELNSHILTHTEDKSSFQCEVCNRDCFTEKDLHKHYRVHTKEKPFKCKSCFRSFSDDSYLRVHERSHHGEEYLKKVMKKDGTYVDPSLVQGLSDEAVAKVSVHLEAEPKQFKNDPNLPLHHEEKLLLLQSVEEFGLNEQYLKLEQIKINIKNSWANMVKLFADNDYDRNVEKLTRTYFHLKNQAKTHIERFYKHKKLMEPHEIDYMFVRLCPTDFDIPGVDFQQVLRDAKKYVSDSPVGAKNSTTSLPSAEEQTEELDPLSESLEMCKESSGSRKRNMSETDNCLPRKVFKNESDDSDSTEPSKMKFRLFLAEEQRKDRLYKMSLKEKEELFDMEKRHREEIHKKELEIKKLELSLLRKKIEYYNKHLLFQCDICEKHFSDEEFLKLHSNTHHLDPFSEIFQADISDSYLEKCRMTVPIEETDRTSFECTHTDTTGKACSRRFGEKEAYEVHLKTHKDAKAEQKIVCHTCKIKFDNHQQLVSHMTDIHGRPESSTQGSQENARTKATAKGKEKTVFKCTICSKCFPVPSKLRSHMRTHTGEKPFKCEVCNKSFGSQGSLKDHSYLHSNDKPFKCTICEKGFTKNSALEDHIRSHTGEKPYECNICKKKYTTIVILNQHLLAHAKEKPFRCDVCDKSFVFLCNLKYHMVTHTGSKPFSCHLCDKSYALKSTLKMHIMQHTGEKPHKCQYCGKQFTMVSSLKKHERIHTGEKPYQCSICQKGFNQTSSLSRHMDSHTGEKPYLCKICNKGLTSASYLKIHLRIHNGEAPYRCKFCDKPFSALLKYRLHMKQHKKEGGDGVSNKLGASDVRSDPVKEEDRVVGLDGVDIKEEELN